MIFDIFSQLIGCLLYTSYYPEKNMEAILRTYVQKCSNANFIFSGSERPLITKMFSEKAHPFYNSCLLYTSDVAEESCGRVRTAKSRMRTFGVE